MTERWEKEILPQIQTLYRQEEVANLLARQHRAFVRMVRKRSAEYMRDTVDGTLSKPMQASAASKAWAFKDFADDLAALEATS